MALRETVFNSAAQNSPANLYNYTPPGSTYQSNFAALGVNTTLLLAPDIRPDIVPSFPEMFTDMAFFMSLKKRAVKGLEWNWFEEPWIWYPIGIRTDTAAVPAVADTIVTQTVPIPNAAIPYVQPGDKITYPDGSNGVVFSKVSTTNAATITINSLVGEALPAVTTDETLINSGPITGDGVSVINSTTTLDTILYNNILEKGGYYARRWDLMQKQAWKNQGTTDYIERDLKAVYMRTLTSMQHRFLLSRYGRTTDPAGNIVTSTSGLLEQMSNAGVQTQTVPTALAVDALKQVVFDTSLYAGGTKIVLGTRRMLQNIGQEQKADKVRYTPENTTWNMDIYQYQFHGHTLIEVPMDQWEDTALYGNTLRNDLLVLNKEDITITYMEGIPMISRQHTLLNQNNGNPTNLFDYDLVWYSTQFGVELTKAWATGRIHIE